MPWDQEIPSVRQRAESQHPDGLSIVRLKCRVDYCPDAGTLEYSIIGWKHPEHELLVNLISHTYDESHLGIAPLDVCAHIWSTLQAPVDPFP